VPVAASFNGDGDAVGGPAPKTNLGDVVVAPAALVFSAPAGLPPNVNVGIGVDGVDGVEGVPEPGDDISPYLHRWDAYDKQISDKINALRSMKADCRICRYSSLDLETQGSPTPVRSWVSSV
jgi:hypothetical protein